MAFQHFPIRIRSLFLLNHLRLAVPPKHFMLESHPLISSWGPNQHASQFFLRTDLPDTPPIIPPQDVRTFGGISKTRLLSKRELAAPETYSIPSDTLERLNRIAPSLAGIFQPRPTSWDELVFKVIQEDQSALVEDSYIAVSYRWNTTTRNQRSTLDVPDKIIFPTSPKMYQAILQERESLAEGLWVDQICIDQDDSEERHIAISLMDLIFQNARAVVIALDDIKLEEDEAEYLRSYIDGQLPAYQDCVPASNFSNLSLSEIAKKILYAQWFERAWCDHEMQLAREHIFLVPYRRRGSPKDIGIARFTGQIFYDLLQHVIFTDLSHAQSQVWLLSRAIYLSNFFFEVNAARSTDQSKNAQQKNLPARIHNEHAAVSQWNSRDQFGDKIQQVGLRRTQGLDVRSIRHVFKLKAGGDPRLPMNLREHSANRDKVGIILNTTGSGLTLNRSHNRPLGTTDECIRSLLLLALAAREPASLCTGGCSLTLENDAKTWLASPGVYDITAGYETRISPRTGLRTDFDSRKGEYVDLDLRFLPVTETSLAQSITIQRYTDQATLFIDRCISFHRAASSSKASPIGLVNSRGPLIQTLAYGLEFGASWMSEIGKQLYREDNNFILLAAVWLQNITDKSDCWNCDTGLLASAILLEFAHFLCLFGTSGAVSPTSWKPTPLFLGKEPALVFIPQSENIQLAVPEALIAPECSLLRRCWLLQANSKDPRPNEWVLVGKSPLLGRFSLSKRLSTSTDVRRHQRVFGQREM